MRSLGKIFLYLAAVLLAGALAAPQAWKLIQGLPPEWLGGLAGEVQRMPFHRYLSRSLQVAAVVLLWPLLRWLNVRSLRELGLLRNPCPARDAAAGVLPGLAGSLVLQAVLLLSGAFVLRGGWSPSVLPKILLSAAVVALLEEFLFRGVVLGFCRQSLGATGAVLLSSLLFAMVHFLNLPAAGAGSPPGCWSGLALLGEVGHSFPTPPLFGWSFATLCAAGLLLGWLTVRTASLWAAAALHGSWILGQQLFNSLALFREGLLPLAGAPQCHGMVPVGLAPLGSLLLAGLLAGWLLRHRPRPSPVSS